jgi:hypothetical protein
VTLEQVFPIVLNFSSASIIPPMVNTHLHLHVALTMTEMQNLGTFHRAMLFRKSSSTEGRSTSFLTLNDEQRTYCLYTQSKRMTDGLHAVSAVPRKGHNANVEYFCRNLINKDGSIKIIVIVHEVVKWITLA